MNTPRQPLEIASPRMQPLSRLPLFFALEGRRVLVAGGNAASAWKAELLSAAGAAVDIVAPAVCEEMAALARTPPRCAIRIHLRTWRGDDFAGKAVAVGDFDDESQAAQFADAARARGVPVNVIDKPAYCDFAFGSIVNRSPLVIGISTDGAAPVFAQALRARIEAMIPQGFARWAEAARRWRSALRHCGLTFAARRRFWQIFTRHALNNPHADPHSSDFDSFLSATAAEADTVERGSVTLVGAGPGDAELLTLRAVRAMQSADAILFDDLVSAQVLDFARREAKKTLVGKTGHGPACRQNEINALMISLARGGKRVVRLKGGDPTIFGRAAEEIAACNEAGIAVEVVPGITAAQGAASRLGLSLTHRKSARRLQYVTGHDADGHLPDDICWTGIADPLATTVVYMPRRTLTDFAARAVAAGLDPATPSLAIANATRPNESVIADTIGNLPHRLTIEAQDGPTLILIGRVASSAARAEPAEMPARSQGLDG